ncbi:interleukin cytokine receptor-related protein 1 isoform X3 [Magallana gigas]|uniref:interleukin cytokine receptor-related protein 1 isoform X3 n=1 Tax=Magallana gigas TaxID=29159 RepID=UPI0033420266
MKKTQQKVLSGLTVVIFILILTKSETASFTVNGVEISSNRTCSSNPNITCFVYFIRDQGCSAKAVTAFPHLYDVSKENKFPEKPQSMVISPFHKKYPTNHKYYPGLTITLKAPVTASFEVLKGFELIYSYNLDSNYGCLIFDLSAAKLTYTDVVETDFWTDIWPMKVTDAPAVLLVSRSLPPAPAEYDRYLNATENAGTWGEWGFCPPNSDCTGTPTPSCQWVTTIMNKALTNDSDPFNKIQVVFALAPTEFPFTIYTISLYNVNDISPVSAVNVTKDHPSHVFKGIPPGTYIVKVLPFDPYFNQGPGRCLCKNEYNTCFPCTTTVTRNFTVGYTADTSGKSEESPHTGVGIIAAVIGVLIGVLLVVVMGFLFFYWRNKDKRDDDDNDTERGDNYNIIEDENIKVADKGNPLWFQNDGLEDNDGERRVLPKKTIFLAYAEDHESHKDVLTSFANFLETHCRCNVIFAPWRLSDIMQDKFRWVINSMEQADYTVIVNSFTAFEQFKQWKTNGKKDSKIFEGSPLADLFIPILNQTCIRLNNQSNYRKFIMVRFEYTSKEHSITELNSGGEYVLTKHLREFLCHVHQIDQQRTKMENVGLAFVDDYTQLPDGTQLKDKIQKAKEYEFKFPRRMDSKMSNDSGMDSLTEEDKATIKENYEQNRYNWSEETIQMEAVGDSITEIIANDFIREPDISYEPPITKSDFHPPSDSVSFDETSGALMDKMLSLNFRNLGYEASEDFIEQDRDSESTFDGESCISIGGRSV